jgi:transcriptional regulator with XRE-family HTH domain
MRLYSESLNHNTQASVYQTGSTVLYAVRMTLNKKIGQRLRAARQAQKLSLSELAARTKTLSKSRISNYEQGIRRMGLEEAMELADALEGLTPTYLLCLDESSPLSPSEWRLISRYRSTDDRGRDVILRVADVQGHYGEAKGPEPQAETDAEGLPD